AAWPARSLLPSVADHPAAGRVTDDSRLALARTVCASSRLMPVRYDCLTCSSYPGPLAHRARSPTTMPRVIRSRAGVPELRVRDRILSITTVLRREGKYRRA